MSKVYLVLRILLGLMLLVFGINKFVPFMPPFDMQGDAATFMGSLVTGNVMTLVAIVEVLTGLALVTNKFVPLMLIVMAPVSVNIVLFHVTFDPGTIAGGLVVFLLNFYLIFSNKSKYESLLS